MPDDNLKATSLEPISTPTLTSSPTPIPLSTEPKPTIANTR
ncbi:hypothetical protein [uncultured Legionella sp.]|nr:hypothetical protein [uncultured Legionella sp.]